MAEATADFVTILSSELIAEIVEAYFNSEMYKVPVKVVDLKPTADGYAFSLAFDSKKEKNADAIAAVHDFYENNVALPDERDAKGRFVSLKKQSASNNMANNHGEQSNG